MFRHVPYFAIRRNICPMLIEFGQDSVQTAASGHPITLKELRYQPVYY